jgi:hypothetical protein
MSLKLSCEWMFSKEISPFYRRTRMQCVAKKIETPGLGTHDSIVLTVKNLRSALGNHRLEIGHLDDLDMYRVRESGGLNILTFEQIFETLSYATWS